MNLYKIYVSTKKKDGTVLKSECILSKAETKDEAIERSILLAKSYGYKGKVHIGSVFMRDNQNQYQKI